MPGLQAKNWSQAQGAASRLWTVDERSAVIGAGGAVCLGGVHCTVPSYRQTSRLTDGRSAALSLQLRHTPCIGARRTGHNKSDVRRFRRNVCVLSFRCTGMSHQRAPVGQGRKPAPEQFADCRLLGRLQITETVGGEGKAQQAAIRPQSVSSATGETSRCRLT